MSTIKEVKEDKEDKEGKEGKRLTKDELREKLHAKVKQKQMGRKNVIQRKQEADGYIKKLGLSDGDMIALKELTEKIIKKKTK